MNQESKDKNKFRDWFERHRLITVGIFLLIIWGSIWVLLYLKADEVTKDPCSVCAKFHGEDVTCSVGKTYIVKRIYHENGSIYDDIPGVRRDNSQVNFSNIFVNSS